jgi:hypothetical protein
MIKIANNRDRNIPLICNEHVQLIRPKILSRLNQARTSANLNKCQYDFINANIDEILGALPDRLEQILSEYLAYCKAKRCKLFNKGLKSVFDYSGFSRKNLISYSAYDLAAKLDVKVCPYCNRQYTFTVVNVSENIIRPEFDHFISKSDYAILSMSFYNLIPSCKVCNSNLKHTKKFKLRTHLHPYLDGFSHNVRFDYLPYDTKSALGFDSNIQVILKKKDSLLNERQLNGNISVFKISEIYQGHKDIVRDLVRRFYMSDGRYLETLLKSFPQIGSYEELYKLAFGNYLNEEDHDQRVLSKLTKDIVEGLDFVVPI